MAASGLIVACGLVRAAGGLDGGHHVIGDVVVVVNVKDDRTGPSGVQRDSVVGGDEPGGELFRVAAGHGGPAVADDAARAFSAADRAVNRQDVPAGIGIGLRRGERVALVDSVRDVQRHPLGVSPCSNRACRAVSYAAVTAGSA